MISVEVKVWNDDLKPLRERLTEIKRELATEMVVSEDNPEVRSATTTYAFLGRIVDEIKEQEKFLREKPKRK